MKHTHLYTAFFALFITIFTGCSFSKQEETPVITTPPTQTEEVVKETDLIPTEDPEIAPAVARIPTPTNTALCTEAPTVNDIGRSVYPTQEEYAHLGILGALFSATDCTRERQEEILGGKSYEEGMTLWTEKAASTALTALFQELKFTCEDTSTTPCTQWGTTNSLTLEYLLKFKPFAKELMAIDCKNCG